MSESIITRIRGTARVVYPNHSHSDRDKETAHALRLIIERKHELKREDLELDVLAVLLEYRLDSPEFAAIMLPLLLEGAITYDTNSSGRQITVKLKGT